MILEDELDKICLYDIEPKLFEFVSNIYLLNFLYRVTRYNFRLVKSIVIISTIATIGEIFKIIQRDPS